MTTEHEMSRAEVLAEGVLSTKVLLSRYLMGFDEATALQQGPNLPNHVIWNLGHLALTMHRVGNMLDGKGIPESELAEGQDAAARGAFWLDSVAFGSAPASDEQMYPSLMRAMAIYNGACDRLAAAIRSADAAMLDKQVAWGAGTLPLWSLTIRMVFHNGFHTGQIADLRRTFGFQSIFS
jgi:hypothetical protein